MNNLIIIAHPDKNSFCYNGILKTLERTLKQHREELHCIDLYEENKFIHLEKEKIKKYKNLITWSNRIYFISPVWWFRTAPLLEIFFDQIFTPGFAYQFIPITKIYGYPKPLLVDKEVTTYLTHGAPALPVILIYLNSVKFRLVMGVYTFVFGWFKTKTRQFWSVPFVSHQKRLKYLDIVEADTVKSIRHSEK